MSTARATDPIRGLPGSYAILIVVVAIAEHTIRTRAFSLLNNTLNRATSLAARSGHGPFSLIRHVGRKSGRTNVAAGGCVVVHHRVDRPPVLGG
jgi:hypothetical protein